MNISSLNGSPPNQSAAGGGASGLNPNGLGKDEFLKLLITQIANQSPLEPMDNTEFIAQLAQFSSVEQLSQVNQGIDTLAAGQAGIISGQAVSMLGNMVVYEGESTYSDGNSPAPIRYKLPESASSVEVIIRDEHGAEVGRLEKQPISAGEHTVYWDDAAERPAGNYRFEIVALDGQGEALDATTYSMGEVTGISFESGIPQILIGEQKISPAEVIEFAQK